MRVLLTGGAGFLGSAFLRRLCVRGDTPGLVARRPDEATAHLATYLLPQQRWSSEALAGIMQRFEPDAILHLAGVRTARSLEDMYEANTFLAVRIMEAARVAAPKAKVVLIGSAAEYGIPLHANGVTREDDVCKPLTDYGIAKHAQTLHGLAMAHLGQPVIVARVSNIVGRDLPLGNVFADMAKKIAASTGEILAGCVDVNRDFLSVDEAARAIMQLVDTPAAVGKVVNIASGKAQSVREGIDFLIERSGRSLSIVCDAKLLRASEVPSISGCVARLASFGIEAPSADIREELRGLMDQWLGR
ncbi:MAG TPA: NAD-dependent epimerase/dehydratase family protein [Hyphomicrobium sp.]|nr:NAD-dependent epimerase/dehydratase family protein [Hyphomicrobium sp.]